MMLMCAGRTHPHVGLLCRPTAESSRPRRFFVRPSWFRGFVVEFVVKRMAYEFLTVRRDGPVEHLVLNRPDVRNAFNAGMIAELTTWAGDFTRQSDARAVVLSGAG